MPSRFKQIRVDKDDVECSGSKKASLQKLLWTSYHETHWMHNKHSKQRSLGSPFGSVGIQNIKSTSRKRDKELHL